jgi:MFS family permease
MLASLKRLPRTVWLIGLISLVNDSSSEMIYPLIPLYVSSVLMAGPKALGLIEGVAEATASLLKLFSGVIVDRTRRSKPLMLIGYFLAGLGRPLIAFTTSWLSLLLIRFMDRIGKGLRSTPRDALLALSVDKQHRGLAFGVHRAMDNAGAVIGPLIAALLLAQGMSLQHIFLWTALPATLCLLLAMRLREPPIEKIATNAIRFDWSLGDMSPRFKQYLIVIGLFSLGNSSATFLLLRANELGITQAHIPLLWAGVSLIATVFGAPLSALSDRWGRVHLIVCGYLVYALFYAGLGLLDQDDHSADHLWTVIGLFAGYAIFVAATEGVEKALVADLAPHNREGTAFGWFNLIAGIMLLPASLIFGWMYEVFSPMAAFFFSASCALLSALGMMWIFFDKKSR